MGRCGIITAVLIMMLCLPVLVLAHPMVIRGGAIEWGEFVIEVLIEDHEHDADWVEGAFSRAITVLNERGEEQRLLSTERDGNSIALRFEATNQAIAIRFLAVDVQGSFPRQLQLVINRGDREHERLVPLSASSLPVVLERDARDPRNRIALIESTPVLRLIDSDPFVWIAYETPVLLLGDWEEFVEVGTRRVMRSEWPDTHADELERWFLDAVGYQEPREGPEPSMSLTIEYTRSFPQELNTAMTSIRFLLFVRKEAISRENRFEWGAFSPQLQRLRAIVRDKDGNETGHTMNQTENTIALP
ncbi:MAG: hypothetical protein ACYTF7_02700 [Planctomycetota bacterium]|jgi:hypothetical protein